MLSVALSLCLLFAAVCGQTGLSGADKQELLEVHNYFRSKVNPIATNMEMMIWNDDLAVLAQHYAEQCIFDHNPFRTNQQQTFLYVGENLAVNNRLQKNYTREVERWHKEVSEYDFVKDSCTGVCGHYTQLVWATSNHVGCGAYRCPNPVPGFPYRNGLILACNYGPGGNIFGRRPYRTGLRPCSACQLPDHKHCVSNLCSSTPAVKLPAAAVKQLNENKY
ncbi:peptidase inhibitor 15-like [Halichondria panicea]|uniref:peptidase inhibitor 15-like n=1 Tax=Halichondria panicea TaxID=6063 RepID=UPI00312B3945